MHLSSLIEKIPSKNIISFLLKLGYLKNGNRFSSFKKIDDKYIYKVDGMYVPSDSMGWYVSPKTILKDCNDICLFNYKVKEGDTVIDIGAGIGEETLCLASLVGNKGRVYSIEANPRIFSILKEVIELNELKNVTAFNLAISEKDEPIQIIEDQNFLAGSIGNPIAQNSKSYTVQGMRMESFLKQHEINKVDLLKANIEGAERFIIQSLGERLHIIRNAAIACHDFRYRNEGNPFFKTKELVVRFFEENGYKVSYQNSGRGQVDDWIYATQEG